MTGFDSKVLRDEPDGYRISFYTDCKEAYELVQAVCRLCIDAKNQNIPIPDANELREKLARYEKAEREGGRLIELPCKNWLDIVFGEQSVFYRIDADYIEEPIREINVDNTERISWYDGWETVYLKGWDENGNYIEFRPEEIGKTVFLTWEEAVAALKEREHDD